MNDNGHPLNDDPRDLQLAAASILGFWLFYFLTIVLRMALLDEDFAWLGYRAGGCLVGIGLTFLVYLVLRRAAGESLRIKVVAAAIACVPAAAIFATFNLAFAIHQPLVARTVVTEHPIGGHMEDGAARKVTLRRRTAFTPIPADFRRQQTPRLIADGLVTWYFLFAAWASFYIALSSAVQLRAAERRAAGAEREAQSAQLRALRYQVNPHFLFNTLNSLSSLVMARRAEEAEAMIANLATFFRSSLTMDPSEDVRLGEEIGFQKLYLDIEQIRFPSRLIVRTEIPDDLAGARLPPLILQPLVENAIKHGVARSARPVTLTITAREEDARLILIVQNDGDTVTLDAEDPGTGTGLANVCERLAARFGASADCEAGPLPTGGYRVTLALPLSFECPDGE